MIADIMSIDTLVLVISIFAAVYGMSMFFYWTGKNRARYEEQSKILESAKLDEYRAHLERQLLELNMKFSSSEKRWQELNHLVVAGQTNNEYEKDADFSRGLSYSSSLMGYSWNGLRRVIICYLCSRRFMMI